MPSRIQTVSVLNLEEGNELVKDDRKSPSVRKRWGRTVLQLAPKGHHRKISSIVYERQPASFCGRMTVSQAHGFPLSPSMLLERRSSETVFEFPSPPPILSCPYQLTGDSPPFSATPSDTSTLSSGVPITPRHSQDEQVGHFTLDLTSKPLPELPSMALNDANNMHSKFPEHFSSDSSRRRIVDLKKSRSADVLLRRPSIKSKPSSTAADKLNKGLKKTRRKNPMLTVMTGQEISFDLPVIVENFPLTVITKESTTYDSDGEEIPFDTNLALEDECKEPDGAFSSSDEEEEYFEVLGPSRALDPIMSVISPRRCRPLQPYRQDKPSMYRKSSRSKPFPPPPCEFSMPSQKRPATPFPVFNSKQPQKAPSNTDLDRSASSILARLVIRKHEKEKNVSNRSPFTAVRSPLIARSMPSKPSFLSLS